MTSAFLFMETLKSLSNVKSTNTWHSRVFFVCLFVCLFLFFWKERKDTYNTYLTRETFFFFLKTETSDTICDISLALNILKLL